MKTWFKATVARTAHVPEAEARGVAAGDIIEVTQAAEGGDFITADGKVFHAAHLILGESWVEFGAGARIESTGLQAEQHA